MSTGNEFISIPDITASRAGIERIGFMYNAFRACIELHGSSTCPLFKPTVTVDGVDLFDGEIASELASYWVPSFSVAGAKVSAKAQVFAPLERRGFACVLVVTNTSDEEITVKAGWNGCWESTYHAARLAKLMAGVKYASVSSWQAGVPVVEYRGSTPLFAMAMMSQDDMPGFVGDRGSSDGSSELSEGSVSATAGQPVCYALVDEYILRPSESKVVPVYVGLGMEEVSAIASARELRMHGWERMLAGLIGWLDNRTIPCADDHLRRLINVNSFYNYFYSQAVALDNEELVLTTARSSVNDSCAAYGDRDALVWSLPAVLQVSWPQARQMLIYAFTTQLPNVGVHSRYISGVVLEPGLALDQLCAPIWALNLYVQTTGDLSVLFDRRVQIGVNTIQQILGVQRHPDVALFETLLLPSGELSTLPYVCYPNVMVWRALKDIARLYERIRDIDRSIEADTLAGTLRAAIVTHFVVDGPFGSMFARAVDLHGNFELADEPVGSLQMLAYHEFCSLNDPVYTNTVAWIHSECNPTSGHGKAFAQPASPSGDGASVMSVVNDLLTGRVEQALDFLRRTDLDDGIACQSVDYETGRLLSGRALASGAGYLAYGLRVALGLSIPDTAVVQQKRRPSEALYQPPPPEASQVPKKARL